MSVGERSLTYFRVVNAARCIIGLQNVRLSTSSPPGFDPRTAQPVASLYTDYATRPKIDQKGSLFKLEAISFYF